jgi:hypothetical protein
VGQRTDPVPEERAVPSVAAFADSKIPLTLLHVSKAKYELM